MKIKNPLILGFISFLFFLIAAVYITYPLIFHISDRVTGYGDELVIAWIQNWVIHALMTSPFSIFEANIYYPYHNTLAFSETFIFTSVLAIPIRLLTGEPISTVNFTLISSLTFLGFSIYLLCFYLTKNFFASLFSGMIVIFSPAVLDYSVHLQLLSIECVPLSILFFLLFIKSHRSLFFGVSLLLFLFQFYNSIVPSYFILFAFVTLILFIVRPYKKGLLKLISRKNIFLLISTIILMIPLAVPYFSVSHEFHYVRDIRDTIHFALQPEDFLYPGNRTRLNNILLNNIPTNHYSENSEFKPGYLGIVFSLLVIFVFIYCIKNIRKNDKYINSFFTISIIGLLLCLGPALHFARHTVHIPFLVPLPYVVFYYLLPGFNGIRDSANWNMLFIIGISVVIALLLPKILPKLSYKVQICVYLIFFVGIILELNFPLKLYTVPQVRDFPKVYSWLNTTPSNTNIIELPIYNWNMTPFTEQELWREYYGTLEFRRAINGYTGFSPPPWQSFLITIDSTFPSNKAVLTLKALGIKYVIVHTDEYDALSKSPIFSNHQIKTGADIVESSEKNPALKIVKKFEDTYVFKIK